MKKIAVMLGLYQIDDVYYDLIPLPSILSFPKFFNSHT